MTLWCIYNFPDLVEETSSSNSPQWISSRIRIWTQLSGSDVMHISNMWYCLLQVALKHCPQERQLRKPYKAVFIIQASQTISSWILSQSRCCFSRILMNLESGLPGITGMYLKMGHVLGSLPFQTGAQCRNRLSGPQTDGPHFAPEHAVAGSACFLKKPCLFQLMRFLLMLSPRWLSTCYSLDLSVSQSPQLGTWGR